LFFQIVAFVPEIHLVAQIVSGRKIGIISLLFMMRILVFRSVVSDIIGIALIGVLIVLLPIVAVAAIVKV